MISELHTEWDCDPNGLHLVILRNLCGLRCIDFQVDRLWCTAQTYYPMYCQVFFIENSHHLCSISYAASWIILIASILVVIYCVFVDYLWFTSWEHQRISGICCILQKVRGDFCYLLYVCAQLTYCGVRLLFFFLVQCASCCSWFLGWSNWHMGCICRHLTWNLPCWSKVQCLRLCQSFYLWQAAYACWFDSLHVSNLHT